MDNPPRFIGEGVFNQLKPLELYVVPEEGIEPSRGVNPTGF